jgi:thioesterase domain-containing protein
MATQLAKEGRRVQSVVLIDTECPQLVKEMPAATRRSFRTTYLKNRVLKYLQNLIEGRFDEAWKEVRQFVLNRVRNVRLKVTTRLISAFGLRAGALFSDDAWRDSVRGRAWGGYLPPRYEGRLVLIKAEARGVEFNIDPTLGWGTYVTGDIECPIVAGDHVTVVFPPFFSAIAEILIREKNPKV